MLNFVGLGAGLMKFYVHCYNIAHIEPFATRQSMKKSSMLLLCQTCVLCSCLLSTHKLPFFHEDDNIYVQIHVPICFISVYRPKVCGSKRIRIEGNVNLSKFILFLNISGPKIVKFTFLGFAA